MNERDRIEYLMNLYGLTPSQFSDKTGIQRASVSHILSNRNKPSLEILLKIYHAFKDVELAWLVAGEGNPPTAPHEGDENEGVAQFVSADEAHRQSNMLFSFMDEESGEKPMEVAASVASADAVAGKVVEGVQAVPTNVATEGKKEAVVDSVRGDDAPPRSFAISADSAKRVKEIKVFYDNGTYETFLPEKV